MVLHLATLNNNAKAAEHEYHDVNVNMAKTVAENARVAGIPLFIYTSSIHALDKRRNDAYAESKRLGTIRLAEVSGIKIVTLYLAAVHGGDWSGKLSALNNLPPSLARLLFTILAAWKPTTSINNIKKFTLSAATSQPEPHVIVTDQQSQNRIYQLASRVIDLTGSIAIAATLWWLFAILWAIIRIQSPGPGIFAQERVGRSGKTFICYKFRTMAVGTTQAATNLVPSSAVTSIGRVLRRSKLDELPQIWNIFKNEMSFIGPRPCLPTQYALIEARAALGVLELKPGISGLSQVEGVDMSDPLRLAARDAHYRALQSLSVDVNIVLDTVSGKGQGDNTAA